MDREKNKVEILEACTREFLQGNMDIWGFMEYVERSAIEKLMFEVPNLDPSSLRASWIRNKDNQTLEYRLMGYKL